VIGNARPTRLVGRSAERKFLSGRFDDALGGRGSVVLVGGEPGLGKSRLLTDLCELAATRGGRTTVTYCLDAKHSPLAPIVDALRELDALAPEVLGKVHPVRRLLAFDAPKAPPGEASVESRRDYYAAVTDALRTFARAAPLVLGLEDVHWADAETRAFLRFLVSKIHGARLLVIATYRSTELADDGFAQFVDAVTRAPAGASLLLRPLERAAMADFIDDALREYPAVSPAMRRAVRLRSEGNPFFAEELLRHAVDPATSERLPQSVRAGVRERIAKLDRTHAEVLEQAAVLGRTFEPELLAAVVGRPIEAIDAALRFGRDALIVIEERATGRWSFRHELLREGLYDSLTSSEAKRLHERIARRLQSLDSGSANAAELAHHWAAAGFPREAAVYDERAGDAAMARYGTLDAADSFQRALLLAPPASRDALRLGLKLGIALDYSGFPERARDVLEFALVAARASGEAAGIAEIWNLIARQMLNQASSVQAIRALERGLEELSDREPAAAPILAALAWLHATRAELTESRAYAERAERCGDTLAQQSRLELLDAHALGLAFAGDIAGSLEAYGRATEIAALIGGRRSTTLLTNRSFTASSSGRMDVALSAADEALRDTWAVSGAVPFVLAVAALTHLRAGNLGIAIAMVREADVLAMEADYPRLTGHIGTPAFALAARTGDGTLVTRYDAARLLDDAFGSDDPTWIGGLAAAVGEWFAASGQTERLAALFERVCDGLATAAMSPELVVLACMHGDERARSGLRRLLHPWRAEGCGELASALFALLDSCDQGREPAAREAAARRAAGGFAACRLPYEEGCALELAGDGGRAASAYRRAGSTAHVARLSAPAEVEFQAHPDRLSKRERQVAELLAGGATNRSIANALGLSERTVETHLRSIYQKLGVTSRLELVTQLLRPPTQVGSVQAR
jgi:DNA-binding CsgD family transcriptional regulator/tetratricopeptide (TPR) repeat protein